MHMRSDLRAASAAGVVVVLVGGVLAWSAWPTLRPARRVTVEAAIPVSGEPVVTPSGAIGPTIQAPGWVEPEPDLVACTALADGVVRELLVLEGDHVESGQIVARLVDDDARLAHDRAVAMLALAEASLESARAEVVEGLAAGDRVVTGGLLKVQDGAPVQVVPAPPAPAASGARQG